MFARLWATDLRSSGPRKGSFDDSRFVVSMTIQMSAQRSFVYSSQKTTSHLPVVGRENETRFRPQLVTLRAPKAPLFIFLAGDSAAQSTSALDGAVMPDGGQVSRRAVKECQICYSSEPGTCRSKGEHHEVAVCGNCGVPRRP